MRRRHAAVTLGGRYQVQRALTRNGKGIVYRAVDTARTAR